MTSYPKLHLLKTKEQTHWSKSETGLFNQTSKEVNAILIAFFCLFLAGLDLNLQRHILLQRACYF